MDPIIRRLLLNRFRSIPSEEVELDNPTFLVGRNGSGKSNLLDAIAFLAEAMVSPLQAVFHRRGGIEVVRNRTPGAGHPRNLGLGVAFGALNGSISRARYAFEIQALKHHGFAVKREQCVVHSEEGAVDFFDRRGRKFTSSVQGLQPSLEPASLGLPVIGGAARFAPVVQALAAMRVYSIEPPRIREMQDPDSGLSLRADGSNTASVMREIERQAPDEAERIGELLASIVPGTVKVKTIKRGARLSLEFTQKWGDQKPLTFTASSMSDGTLRALGLLAAVFQPSPPSLIAIEEPEATLHPGAIGAILDLLRHASRRVQLVATTHSPDVLEADWLEDRHLRIVTWEKGATRVTPVSKASREALQEHLQTAGELLRSNALWGMPTPAAPAPTGLFEDVAA